MIIIEQTNIHKETARLKFLSDYNSIDLNNTPAKSDFIGWVASFIDGEKAQRLSNIFVNETASLIGACKRELFRVFYGFPKVDSSRFDNERNELAFEAYRKNKLNDWQFAKQDLFEALFTSPSSILCLFPYLLEDGKKYGFMPKLVEQDCLKNIETKDGQIVEALFDINKIGYLFSGGSLQIGEFDQNGKFIPTNEIATNGIFCRFIAPQYDGKDPKQRKGVLSPYIQSLSFLLYSANALNYADQYGAFPNMVVFEERCSYMNKEQGHCQNGYLTGSGNPCPSCTSKPSRYLGPGNLIEVPAPQDKEDANLIEAIKIFGGDVANLEYLTSKVKEREKQLFYSIVGITESSKAYNNEEYIRASLESRETILQRLASILESTHFWLLDTLARQMYGGDYKGGVLSYGNKFFESEKQQKETQRERLLNEVVPYFDLTVEQVLALSGIAPAQDIIFRLNWAFWIARFERANGVPIEEFGKLSQIQDKGQEIYKQIITLINENNGNEINTSQQEPQPQS